MFCQQLLLNRAKELYPSKLRSKFSKSSFALPSVIYYSGNIKNIDKMDYLGVVGSRNIDDDPEVVTFTNKLVELAVENKKIIKRYKNFFIKNPQLV